MPLFEQHTSGKFSWGIWKTDESSEILRSYLTKNYEQALAAFSLETRKQDFLAARLLIKLLTGEEKDINYHPSGKPVCKDNSFQISISHTKGYVAVIVHPSENVGIDVEYISPRVEKVKKRFLSNEELAHVDHLNEINYLLVCWSAKESMFKAIDREVVIFNQHLHLHPFSIQSDNIIRAFESKTSDHLEYDIHFKIYTDFVLTFIPGEKIKK